MMTRREHLLLILAEEANEVAQRVSKALRFGCGEVQPGQELTNAERLAGEAADFLAVLEMLVDSSSEIHAAMEACESAIEAKKAKVEKFLTYSKECGTLE